MGLVGPKNIAKKPEKKAMIDDSFTRSDDRRPGEGDPMTKDLVI